MNANALSTASKLPKRVHIVGICGVATSALAIAFHKAGVAVTGSDKGFFPPVSTYLSEAGIPYYAGWHPEKIAEGGEPDLIVAGGGGTSLSNPEVIYAKERGIRLMSFAEALGAYVIRRNSIVVTGTWGKTTTSALLSYILIQAGLDPSYFTGGLSLSHDTSALTDSDWSVAEGDEYQVAIWDKRPKFELYAPTHLLLTSVSWDHADLYPTEAAYFAAFEKLLRSLPAGGEAKGALVACIDDAGVQKTLSASSAPIAARATTYGKTASADYYFHDISHTRDGLRFSITHRDAGGAATDFAIASPMLGRFNAENIAAAFAMAHIIGIAPEKIIAAVASFKGIRRRFEKRLDGATTAKGVSVLDCHAPTPEKAASVLESVREVYPAPAQVIAIYEPNIGGRQRESAHMYDDAFKDATTVLIPRLTKLKVADDRSSAPIDGPELAALISKSHAAASYFGDDATLNDYIPTIAKKDDVVVFLGSHGFRGMIEEAVKRLS